MTDGDDLYSDVDKEVLRARRLRARKGGTQAGSPTRGGSGVPTGLQDLDRDVDSVTEQLALEQELETIRGTLREKERLVDLTAAQCSRLEDELEDQHLAYDGLKQDLERKKRSLEEAREQTTRLSEEREEIEDRYQALLASGGRRPASDGPAGASLKLFLANGVRAMLDLRFIGGLAAGFLLAAALVLMRADLLRSADSPDSAAPIVAVPSDPETPAARDEIGQEPSAPTALGSAQDRLRDGSSGPLMMVLPGGTFTMGKLRALPNDDASPAHDVTLGGFLIGATEVTFAEYDRFARATGRRLPNDYGWGRGRRPVIDVAWSDAEAYAEWLSRQTGNSYRLPSESEWEYATSAGRRSFFWWGYDLEPGRAACYDCGSKWDNRSTAPVGSFDANPLGLYDTAGNVMEWVRDCYQPSYIGVPLNGQPRTLDGCSFRVARGGAFNKPARSMYSTARHRFVPETRINALGFRVARDE